MSKFLVLLLLMFTSSVFASKAQIFEQFLRLKPIDEALFTFEIDQVMEAYKQGLINSKNDLKKEVERIQKEIDSFKKAINSGKAIPQNLLDTANLKLKEIGEIHNEILKNVDGNLEAAKLSFNKLEYLKQLRISQLENVIKNYDLLAENYIQNYFKEFFDKNFNSNLKDVESDIRESLAEIDVNFKKINDEVKKHSEKLNHSIITAKKYVSSEISEIKLSVENERNKFQDQVKTLEKTMEDKISDGKRNLNKAIEDERNKLKNGWTHFSSQQVMALSNAQSEIVRTQEKIKEFQGNMRHAISELQNFNIQEEISAITNEQKLDIAFTLVAKADPKVAESLEKVYKTYQQVKQTYEMAQSFMANGMSGALMLGGPVGVAFAAMQAVSEAQKADAQMAMMKMILKEIREIKEMIVELHKDMREQFDLVHQRFDILDKKMDDNLETLVSKLEDQNLKLDELKSYQVDIWKIISFARQENRDGNLFHFDNNIQRTVERCKTDDVNYLYDTDKELYQFVRECINDFKVHFESTFRKFVVDSVNVGLTHEIDPNLYLSNYGRIVHENMMDNQNYVEKRGVDRQYKIPHFEYYLHVHNKYLNFLDSLLQNDVELSAEIISLVERHIGDVNGSNLRSRIAENVSLYDNLLDEKKYDQRVINYLNKIVVAKNKFYSATKGAFLQIMGEILQTSPGEVRKLLSYHGFSSDDFLPANDPIIGEKTESRLKRNLQEAFTAEAGNMPLTNLKSFKNFNDHIYSCGASDIPRVEGLQLNKIFVPKELANIEFSSNAFEICALSRKRFETNLTIDEEQGNYQSYQHFNVFSRYGIEFLIRYKAKNEGILAKSFRSPFVIKDGKMEEVADNSSFNNGVFRFALISNNPLHTSRYEFHVGRHGNPKHRGIDFANSSTYSDTGLCTNAPCHITKTDAKRHLGGKNYGTLIHISMNNLPDTFDEMRNFTDLRSGLDTARHRFIHGTLAQRRFSSNIKNSENLKTDQEGFNNLIASFNQNVHSAKILKESRSRVLVDAQKKLISSLVQNGLEVTKGCIYSTFDSEKASCLYSINGLNELNKSLVKYGNARNDFQAFMKLTHFEYFEGNEPLMHIFYSSNPGSKISSAMDLLAGLNEEKNGLENNIDEVYQDIISVTKPKKFNLFEKYLEEYSNKVFQLKEKFKYQELNVFERTRLRF